MQKDAGESKPKRSKIWRVIVILLALSYFWTARHTVWIEEGRIVRYNRWTGTTSWKGLDDPRWVRSGAERIPPAPGDS